MKKKSKKTSSDSQSSSKHKGMKKERGVLPYITTPFIYVLISLIVIIPAFISFTNYAIAAVHNVQEDYAKDYNDRSVSTERYDNNTIVYEKDMLWLCEKVGVIKCESVGIKQDVYFGINRVSLRSGAGLSAESNFNGAASKFNIAGYSSRAFKGLENISEGDTIVFETSDKIYKYTAVSNSICKNPENNYSSGLILSCDDNSRAFSALSSEKRYVVASFSSVSDKKGE